MSKNIRTKQLDNINHINNNSSSKQSDNKQYNVIIKQPNTIYQNNSINIMLDSSLTYFQNINNYQINENEPNKNQKYSLIGRFFIYL